MWVPVAVWWSSLTAILRFFTFNYIKFTEFWTSQHRMIKLGGRCIVQKSRLSSNLGVIALLGVQPPKIWYSAQSWCMTQEVNKAMGSDETWHRTHRAHRTCTGKIGAGCLDCDALLMTLIMTTLVVVMCLCVSASAAYNAQTANIINTYRFSLGWVPLCSTTEQLHWSLFVAVIHTPVICKTSVLG